MNTTAKTLSALLLGAALVTPALAQDTAPSANNGNSATAQTSNAAPVAAPTMPVDSSASSSVAANNSSQANDNNANASSSGNSQTAMNTTGNAADLSSVPDTSKKYSRSNRARDYKKEAQVTAQLNQKESSMNGTSAQ